MKKLKMIKMSLFGGAMFAALSAMSGAAGAAIVSPVTIDFGAGATSMPSAVYGLANVTPRDAAGNCQLGSGGDCYYEDGAVVGIPQDLTEDGGGAHLHRAGLSSNRQLQYHADSSGIYVRAQDGTAFKLESLDFRAPFSDSNPDPNEDSTGVASFEILGFNTAVNPDLYSGDGINYPTRVAYQQVPNGTDVNGLLMNAAFGNINAFWIHATGYPATPTDIKDWNLLVDNIKLAAPVPVPGAVWLFGSALAGLVSFGRKKKAGRTTL